MAQLDVLRNSAQILNTLRGPAKILYATFNAPMPSNILQFLDPTLGVPASPWKAFGFTRGGVNWSVNIEASQRDDIDQITGAYDQDVTDYNFQISSQLAEVFDTVQLGMAFKMGVPTYVMATTSQPTQVMTPLNDGTLKFPPFRFAVVYPKDTTGKVMAYVLRNGQLTGGEKVIRFDKNDSASPALEIRGYPELSTAIPAADAYGRLYDIP
jgi:hypothetical protein